MLTHIELFAGIGMWHLGGLWAGGIETIGRSENNQYKNNVYDLRFPGVPNYGDIEHIQHLPYADIISVSFPCTGISTMGKGLGLADPGSRLWFESARLIRDSRPRYIVVENVPALTMRGLDTILAFLAGLGYDAEWTHLEGHQFGFQQRRKRLFLVAYTREVRREVLAPQGYIFRKLDNRIWIHPAHISPGWTERREIPQPRNFKSTNEYPHLIRELECIGDAVMPIIAQYIFECIKLDFHDQQH